MQTAVPSANSLRSSGNASGNSRHPDRESSIAMSSEVFACGSCRTPVAQGHKFCPACGQRLGTNCSKCNASMMPGEKFCGECGTSTEPPRKSKVDAYRRSLDRAIELIEGHQYVDAEVTLRAVAKSPDAELAPLIAEGVALRERIARETEHYKQAVANTLQTAQQLAVDCHYHEIITAIDEIPAVLRGEQLEKLRLNAKASMEEIARLDREMREAIAANRLVAALTNLKRLHQLQPRHSEYQSLATRASSAVHNGVKKLVEQQQFDDALKLMLQIPEFARSEEMTQLLGRLEEVTWSLRQLRESTLATSVLQGIADRLHRVLPRFPEVGKSRDQIAARIQQGPSAADLAAADWIAPPENNALGLSIRWLAGQPALRFATDEVAQTWKSHPGTFFSAVGLALQGLGLGSIELNLTPAEQRSRLLGGLSKAFRKSPTAIWGLDIGASSIKAVRVSLDRSSESLTVEQCELIEYPRSWMEGTPDHADSERRRMLQFFVERNRVRGESAVVGIPGSQLLAKVVSVPRGAGKKMESLVDYEARQQIPVPLEELVWDHAEISMPGEANTIRLFLIACKKKFVEPWMRMVLDAGLKIEGLQAQPIALHHYANHFYGRKLQEHEAILWFDTGHAETQVLLSGPRTLWFRSLPFGSQDVNRALVRELQLSDEDAEYLKRDLLRSRRLQPANKVMQSAFKRLHAEIMRSVQLATSQHAGCVVRSAHVCGGGACVHGLIDYLRLE